MVVCRRCSSVSFREELRKRHQNERPRLLTLIHKRSHLTILRKDTLSSGKVELNTCLVLGAVGGDERVSRAQRREETDEGMNNSPRRGSTRTGKGT